MSCAPVRTDGQSVAIINTGVANTASVLYAFERLGLSCRVTQDPAVIGSSTHVILPGVGNASASMAKLKAQGLDRVICALKQPVLGICLGMQLFFEESEEGRSGENTKGLGIFKGIVSQLRVNLVVPHMGWNQLRMVAPSAAPSQLLKGIPEGSYFYFVHSYVAPSESLEIKAVADYGHSIPAVLEFENWFGTQFHPEKSGELGQEILRNFIGIKGGCS